MSSSFKTSSLSDSQEIAISLLLLISMLLSVLGSSTIIFKIFKSRKKLMAYERIMLCLSFSDILASLSFALTPFLMPEGLSVWSVGNQTTCSALGFLTQLGFAVIGNNLILSIYFLLTIKFGVKKDQFAKRFEKPLLIFNATYFFTTAIVGLIIGLYSPVDIGFGCWVNDWPKGCTQTGNCLSQNIGLVYLGAPTLLTFFALLINNVTIYIHVRKTFHKLTPPANVGMTAEEALAARNHRRFLQEDKQIRLVATQGFLYVVSFIVCYTASIILRIIEAQTYNPDDAQVYPLLVIAAFTLPLQGFFNMLVYNRVPFLRIREAFPQMNRFQAFRKACLDPNVPLKSNSLSPSDGPIARNLNLRGIRSKSSKFSSSLEVVQEEIAVNDDEALREQEDFEKVTRQEKYASEAIDSGGNTFWGSMMSFSSENEEENELEEA